MFLLNLFSKRFKTPCNCSPNIWFLWLYATNVTVSSIMPFFRLLNMISVFKCHDDLRVDIRWKHTCGQKWKQSIHENKTYKHTKVICFCRPTVHFQPEQAFSLNWHFFFLGINFPKKDILGGKWKKMNITTEFCIVELVLVQNFTWTDNIDFCTKLTQKGYFRSKTENLHFCMGPCSLLTISNFSTQ